MPVTKNFQKISILSVMLMGLMFFAYADRGFTKKSKNRVKLNINTNTNFKKALSLNLKTGLKYKGSLVSSSDKTNISSFTNRLVTYQKGNTVYIIPYKQKVIVSEVKQGYTGMKLIIKSN